MNEDVITVVGRLGGDPTLKSVRGDRVAEFRLASKARRKDGETWVDGHTNWFSVEAWGDFAAHVAASLRRGDLVVVLGKLKVEDWESGERRGTSVKIRADHIGPTLRAGAVTKDRRAPEAEPVREAEPAPEPAEQGWPTAVAAGAEPAPVLQGAGETWSAPLAEAETPF
ncbi:MAG: single-stranded DNA-binding protein [Actinomycetota bacterium]